MNLDPNFELYKVPELNLAMVLHKKLGGEGYIRAMYKEIFELDEYKELNVKNRVVIDIGGFTGDSAIYFHRKGARKIIAIEPFIYGNKYLEINARLNGVEDITVIKGGCGNITYLETKLDDEFVNTGGNFLEDAKGTGKLQFFSLQDIIKNNVEPNEQIALKVDCEGCEANCLAKAPVETFKDVIEIIYECHINPTPMINKLREAGYHIWEKRYWWIDVGGQTHNGLYYCSRVDQELPYRKVV